MGTAKCQRNPMSPATEMNIRHDVIRFPFTSIQKCENFQLLSDRNGVCNYTYCMQTFHHAFTLPKGNSGEWIRCQLECKYGLSAGRRSYFPAQRHGRLSLGTFKRSQIIINSRYVNTTRVGILILATPL